MDDSTTLEIYSRGRSTLGKKVDRVEGQVVYIPKIGILQSSDFFALALSNYVSTLDFEEQAKGPLIGKPRVVVNDTEGRTQQKLERW